MPNDLIQTSITLSLLLVDLIHCSHIDASPSNRVKKICFNQLLSKMEQRNPKTCSKSLRPAAFSVTKKSGKKDKLQKSEIVKGHISSFYNLSFLNWVQACSS
ncbi:hypothetical protein CHARACLAT_027564 [Characodon lateralis]|uniref:Interleukin-4 n=1 Tax=Characodon lateralis TaxID=208331 RepID=A0ABU7DUQ8_9TELE|nr:hypothetical protein [Characodon lateralis]